MKNSYILLRSNKESGPFSAEELQQQGLKPDDLLWVEGQSVAWQRPAEIPSLRNLVQPGAGTVDNNAGAIENEPINTTVKSTVYVALPEEHKSYLPLPKEEMNIQDKEKEIPKKKYEKPLDEIKDMYVKALEERKKRMANRKRTVKLLRYAGVVLGLVLAGALLGIALQKKWNRKSLKDETSAKEVTLQKVEQTQIAVPLPQDTIAIHENPDHGQVSTHSESISRGTGPDPDKNEVRVAEPTPVLQKDEPVRPENQPVVQPRVNQEAISSLVAVKANDYRIGSFGGIRDLQLTVTNDSPYPLEKVMVELQYLKLGDEVVKSEVVLFHAVPANGSRTLDIPASKRGVKVAWKIMSIDPSPKANVAGF